MSHSQGSETVRVGVDVGGTFTDVALEAGGRRFLAKAPTTPAAPDEGILAGLAEVLSAAGRRLDEVGLIIHGTTLPANALIERRGAAVAFLTTAGHRDTLEIADESRFANADLDIDKPAPLVPRRLRFGVPERMDARGRTLLPLDEEAVADAARQAQAAGARAVAIGFLHSYVNDAHERRAGEIVSRVAPALDVTLSSAVAPEMREYERFSTACANAYIRPLVSAYLDRLETALARAGVRCPLLLMLSNGGLTTADVARRLPILLVESGPAGGAVFAAHMASACGLRDVLAFEMGGTTAKLCLVEGGRLKTARSFEVARHYRFLKGSGLPLRVPVVELVEIGAGGGSIARLDSVGRIAVGPRSAGAEPGPVAYGRGGQEPTITDANLIVGRIRPDAFAGGRISLDREASRSAMAGRIGAALGCDDVAAAAGVIEILEEDVAAAARAYCLEHNIEPESCALMAFGGAAPLHAAAIAEKLGIVKVVIPPDAGVGSAIGFLRAPLSFACVRSLYQTLHDFDGRAVADLLAALRGQAEAVLRQVTDAPLEAQAVAYVRYVGQGHELEVGIGFAPDQAALAAAFEEAYRRQYGRLLALPVEIMAWKVVAAAPSPPAPEIDNHGAAKPCGTAPLFDHAVDEWVSAVILDRDALASDEAVEGPAVLTEMSTATLVPAGFQARRGPAGALILEGRSEP